MQHSTVWARAAAVRISMQMPARIMELYRQRIGRAFQDSGRSAFARQLEEMERQLRLATLRAERAETLS